MTSKPPEEPSTISDKPLLNPIHIPPNRAREKLSSKKFPASNNPTKLSGIILLKIDVAITFIIVNIAKRFPIPFHARMKIGTFKAKYAIETTVFLSSELK